jgi:hypothetical protein
MWEYPDQRLQDPTRVRLLICKACINSGSAVELTATGSTWNRIVWTSEE